MFDFPCWIVPFQIVEECQNSGNVVEVLGHPFPLQNAFGDVPFVGCPLEKKKSVTSFGLRICGNIKLRRVWPVGMCDWDRKLRIAVEDGRSGWLK